MSSSEGSGGRQPLALDGSRDAATGGLGDDEQRGAGEEQCVDELRAHVNHLLGEGRVAARSEHPPRCGLRDEERHRAGDDTDVEQCAEYLSTHVNHIPSDGRLCRTDSLLHTVDNALAPRSVPIVRRSSGAVCPGRQPPSVRTRTQLLAGRAVCAARISGARVLSGSPTLRVRDATAARSVFATTFGVSVRTYSDCRSPERHISGRPDSSVSRVCACARSECRPEHRAG